MRIVCFLFILFILSILKGISQKAAVSVKGDEAAILSVMKQQENDWNEGNIEAFMQGYWPSDSLRFIGRSGLTKGWQATLDGYRKSYPGKEGMGTLRFDILQTDVFCHDGALVIGRYFLQSSSRSDEGIFSLTWRKIDGSWKIIADHTQATKNP